MSFRHTLAVLPLSTALFVVCCILALIWRSFRPFRYLLVYVLWLPTALVNDGIISPIPFIFFVVRIAQIVVLALAIVCGIGFLCRLMRA